MENIIIILLAFAVDLIFGDPPTRFHPVGWMGKMISMFVYASPKSNKIAQFAYGLLIVLLGIMILVTPVYFLLDYLDGISRIAFIIIGALLLKSVFSIKGLYRAASQVMNQLETNNVQEARSQMTALVSRDPDELDEPMMVAATVESVAESTSDSYVAPLFWFLILGVPGATAYRLINTFDSMIGYRGEYEYLGKFAARLDDILNLIPARITGLLFIMAAILSRKDMTSAWQIMIRDYGNTQSPNAGWPMSAMAGALGVQLEKNGHYSLGDAHNQLTTHTIKSAILLMWLVVTIWSLICLGIEGVKHVL